jgi:8-oxo-dGTP pyrophosphatase MutT (NUDIX family)
MDSAISWWVDGDGVYWHETVGIFLVDALGRILCIKRRIFPLVLAIPAGHLDCGEEPMDGAYRELYEETGIAGLELIHRFRFVMAGDSCSRGSDDHVWNLFAGLVNHPLDITLCNEAEAFFWLTRNEIEAHDDAGYALRYILTHYGNELVGY